LIEARGEKRLLHLQRRLVRLKFLIIDEMGIVFGSEHLTRTLLDRIVLL